MAGKTAKKPETKKLESLPEWGLSVAVLEPSKEDLHAMVDYLRTHHDARRVATWKEDAAFALLVHTESEKRIFSNEGIKHLATRKRDVIQRVLKNNEPLASKIVAALSAAEVKATAKKKE